jgi:hypothetical protein
MDWPTLRRMSAAKTSDCSNRYFFCSEGAGGMIMSVTISLTPSFRSRQKPAKQSAADQHCREALHQRPQPMLRNTGRTTRFLPKRGSRQRRLWRAKLSVCHRPRGS